MSLFLDRAGGTPGAGLQIVSEALAVTEPVVVARMGCIVGTAARTQPMASAQCAVLASMPGSHSGRVGSRTTGH